MWVQFSSLKEAELEAQMTKNQLLEQQLSDKVECKQGRVLIVMFVCLCMPVG